MNLSEHIVEAENIDKTSIPKEWLPQKEEHKFAGDNKWEQIGSLVRNYITFVMKRMTLVSQTFSSTIQHINALLTKKLQPVEGEQEQPRENKEMKDELDKKTVAICTQLIMQVDKALSIILGANKSFTAILRYGAVKKPATSEKQ